MPEEIYGLTPQSANDFKEMQREHHRTRNTAPTWAPAQPIQQSRPSFYPVRVKKTGGAGGNASGYATWEYSLFYLSDTNCTGTPIATALQPENSPARIAKWTVAFAPDKSVGEAYTDSSGNVKLYNCPEKIANQTNCQPPTV